MIDFIVLLLIAFIALLIVQIIALIRIRQIITRLKNILVGLGLNTVPHSNRVVKQQQLPVKIRVCKFCKHRQTYIKATISGEGDDFYYRCQLSNTSVRLSSSCERFQLEANE